MSIAENLTAIAENVPKVYEAGKKAAHSDFWDAFQNNGKRTDYTQAFSYEGWTNKNFNPKYVIKPTNATQMFYRNQVLSEEVEGVINADFSNCTNLTQAFQDFNKITRLGTLDLRKVTVATNAFAFMSALQKIDKIILDESSLAFGFTSCISLSDVTIEGVVGNSMSFKTSPLTIGSMKSVISHLKDYSGTENEYTYTVTFKSSEFSALEAEGATAEYNGVACTWAELIDNKKWNLVKG